MESILDGLYQEYEYHWNLDGFLSSIIGEFEEGSIEHQYIHEKICRSMNECGRLGDLIDQEEGV